MENEIQHQLNCLKYHLSEAIEDRDNVIEKIKDIKKEMKDIKGKCMRNKQGVKNGK